MLATLRKPLILIPLTLVASFSLWAQNVTTIEGDVKGADGKPLQGALIKIERQDTKGSFKMKTDKKGHYSYATLPAGKFRVTLEVDGQDQASKDVQTNYTTAAEANFDLQANAAKAKSPVAAPAPGQQVSEEDLRKMSPAQRAEYEQKLKDQQAAQAKSKALNDSFNAGKEAMLAKNWGDAITSFQKAGELDPSQPAVWGSLAEAYSERSKTRTGADKQADLDQAVASYQKVLAIKPDDPGYHNNYALVLANEKKFDDAQAELTKAATLDPANAGKYYFNLGAVYVNTSQSDPATAAFKKAIELQPDYAEAYFQLGIALSAKATTSADGKMVAPAGTEDAFQKYLSLSPEGPNADAAKAMIQALGSTVQTTFSKPGAAKQAPAGGSTTKKKQP